MVHGAHGLLCGCLSKRKSASMALYVCAMSKQDDKLLEAAEGGLDLLFRAGALVAAAVYASSGFSLEPRVR